MPWRLCLGAADGLELLARRELDPRHLQLRPVLEREVLDPSHRPEVALRELQQLDLAVRPGDHGRCYWRLLRRLRVRLGASDADQRLPGELQQLGGRRL